MKLWSSSFLDRRQLPRRLGRAVLCFHSAFVAFLDLSDAFLPGAMVWCVCWLLQFGPASEAVDMLLLLQDLQIVVRDDLEGTYEISEFAFVMSFYSERNYSARGQKPINHLSSLPSRSLPHPNESSRLTFIVTVLVSSTSTLTAGTSSLAAEPRQSRIHSCGRRGQLEIFCTLRVFGVCLAVLSWFLATRAVASGQDELFDCA